MAEKNSPMNDGKFEIIQILDEINLIKNVLRIITKIMPVI